MRTGVALVIGLLLILMTACVVEVPAKLVTVLVEKISKLEFGEDSVPTRILLPLKEPRTRVVIPDTLLQISSGEHTTFRFVVTDDMENARLVGSFRASGGSSHDIVVCLMDAATYPGWVNRAEVSIYYNSGQVNTDSFDLGCLRPGIYCLVFSNRFSAQAGKRVATRTDLKFMR